MTYNTHALQKDNFRPAGNRSHYNKGGLTRLRQSVIRNGHCLSFSHRLVHPLVVIKGPVQAASRPLALTIYAIATAGPTPRRLPRPLRLQCEQSMLAYST
jgi:hypothetical protein